MKPTEKDYMLLHRALYIAHTTRQNPDDIGDDFYTYNHITEKLSIADKLSMADLLIHIARNYHSQVKLEIENMETLADYNSDGDDKKSVYEWELIQKLLHRVVSTQKKIHSASDSVYDQYQDFITGELDTDEKNS